MRKLLTATLAIGVALTAVSAADAREGCGRGGHRGDYGHCRPNRGGPGVGRRDVLVVDRFYQGRGYWDGHRYWQHRDRREGGWRYR